MLCVAADFEKSKDLVRNNLMNKSKKVERQNRIARGGGRRRKSVRGAITDLSVDGKFCSLPEIAAFRLGFVALAIRQLHISVSVQKLGVNGA
nr:hypothetical protein Iba_chr06cCG13240 [Ipomoea batatas]